ncbi:hypothetical protein HYT56_02910 [Candidatus Woesearchaeota archaeon]|nr:hypothetical protein [Candidatus Woesearchaeota archaeon]
MSNERIELIGRRIAEAEPVQIYEETKEDHKRYWNLGRLGYAALAAVVVIGSGAILHTSGKSTAIRRIVEPLRSTIEALASENAGLKNINERLNNNITSLTTERDSLRESNEGILNFSREYVKKSQEKLIYAQRANAALLESYPDDIRSNDYKYSERTQNGKRVAQLEIIAYSTEDPEELAKRFETKKGFEEKYPGLLDKAEKIKQIDLRKLRLTENDDNVFEIRPTYEGETTADTTFTYRHLDLINYRK